MELFENGIFFFSHLAIYFFSQNLMENQIACVGKVSLLAAAFLNVFASMSDKTYAWCIVEVFKGEE